jgi:hypothetical protein
MRRYATLLLVVGLPALLSAQTAKKSLAAKPAAAKPMPTPIPTVSTVPSPPFDSQWQSIPPSFRPDDFSKTFAANQVSPKDEFETEAQYQARIKVDADRVYVFQVERAGFKYDADKQQFSTPFAVLQGGIRDSRKPDRKYSTVYVELGKTREEGPETVGTNGFGAKVTISHVTNHVQGIAIGAPSQERNYRLPDKWMQLYKAYKRDGGIEMPAEEARLAKQDLSVMVVVRGLTGGFGGAAALKGSSYSAATFDAPTELLEQFELLCSDRVALVFYNRVTGKIYKKRAL